jgi:hypothetical protein
MSLVEMLLDQRGAACPNTFDGLLRHTLEKVGWASPTVEIVETLFSHFTGVWVVVIGFFDILVVRILVWGGFSIRI